MNRGSSFPHAFSGNPGGIGMDPRLKHSGVTVQVKILNLMPSTQRARDLTVAVGSPGSAVDPQLREFERVGVGLPLRVESAAAPAEDRDAFFFLTFEISRWSLWRPTRPICFVGFHVDPVAPVGFSSHGRKRMKDEGGRMKCRNGAPASCLISSFILLPLSFLQILTLPPLNLMPNFASASTTGMSAPSALPTSAASGRSLS